MCVCVCHMGLGNCSTRSFSRDVCFRRACCMVGGELFAYDPLCTKSAQDGGFLPNQTSCFCFLVFFMWKFLCARDVARPSVGSVGPERWFTCSFLSSSAGCLMCLRVGAVLCMRCGAVCVAWFSDVAQCAVVFELMSIARAREWSSLHLTMCARNRYICRTRAAVS